MSSNDRELSAIIVRNIIDIEDAIGHAEKIIDDRLSKEFNAVFDRQFDINDWYLSEDKDYWESWFCPNQWTISGKSKPETQLTFGLHIIGEDGFHSWLASIVTGNKERGITSLWLKPSIKTSVYKKAWDESKEEIAQIQEAGFIIDDYDIYYPILIEAEALAVGFENDDLAPAIEQFEKAAIALDRAMPAFDKFHSNIVAAAS